MSRARQRAERIRNEVHITQVLADYGYPIHVGYSNEEQFPCDMHGDGQDNTPSARVYPDSNSWYCFACDRTRDSVETVREKEGCSFWDAVRRIEKRYKLPPLPYEDDGEPVKAGTGTTQAIQAALDPARTFEEDRNRLFRLLDGFTTDRDLPLATMLGLWEAYDKIVHLVDKDITTEDTGRKAMARIRLQAMEKLKG